eukprot:9727077-Prorocentrum_lima.AAC.1
MTPGWLPEAAGGVPRFAARPLPLLLPFALPFLPFPCPASFACGTRSPCVLPCAAFSLVCLL